MNKTTSAYFIKFSPTVGMLLMTVFCLTNMTLAENISKTFEFGTGTQNPSSNVRTFNIPSNTPGGIAAVVKYRRLGEEGSTHDISILIELREPDIAPEQEGSVVETRKVLATKIEQSITLRAPSSSRGCSLPWRVRVRHFNDGAAPTQIFGTIRLDYDGRQSSVNPTWGFLGKGETKTVNLGDVSGFGQGNFSIQGVWRHAIGISLLIGPNPIKLRFTLIDPNGANLASAEGFSSRETSADRPHLKLDYRLTRTIRGQWKLKVTNLETDDDASDNATLFLFISSCN